MVVARLWCPLIEAWSLANSFLSHLGMGDRK